MRKEKQEREERRALAPWRSLGELKSWPSLFGDWPGGRRLPRLAGELFGEPWAAQGWALLPATDVSEDDDHYTVSVELPGTKRDDVHVEIEEGMLTIRGEKKSEREEKKEQSRYMERSYGSFCRSFRLPADADVEHLRACFKDGVLAITIPKTEEAKPRSIAIKAG